MRPMNSHSCCWVCGCEKLWLIWNKWLQFKRLILILSNYISLKLKASIWWHNIMQCVKGIPHPYVLLQCIKFVITSQQLSHTAPKKHLFCLARYKCWCSQMSENLFTLPKVQKSKGIQQLHLVSFMIPDSRFDNVHIDTYCEPLPPSIMF